VGQVSSIHSATAAIADWLLLRVHPAAVEMPHMRAGDDIARLGGFDQQECGLAAEEVGYGKHFSD
jgi:hypothetical protein